MAEPAGAEKRIFGVTRNVFALGLTSLLNDLSSEVALKTIPFLLKNLLSTSVAFIGVIEGAAESTATLVKMLSGWLSDRMGRRKPLTLMGYGLAALTRPLLFLVRMLGSWWFVFGLRVTDRVGKGVRGAPRDALIADSCAKEERGHSFGFQRAMDEFGSFSGFALAGLVIYLSLGWARDLNWGTYWWLVLLSVVTAAGAVTVLWVMVKEPRHEAKPAEEKAVRVEETTGASSEPMGGVFWFFLVILVFFTLGNSADAFLLIDSQDLGVPLFVIFLVYGGTSALAAITAIPAGKLSDVIGRKTLIVTGWTIYAGVYLAFALQPRPWLAAVVLVIYGAYYGMTEGIYKAVVADLVPASRRGLAYGFFNGAIGIGALPASVIAGLMWDHYVGGFHLPFFFGAVMAGLAVVLLLFLPLHKGPTQR